MEKVTDQIEWLCLKNLHRVFKSGPQVVRSTIIGDLAENSGEVIMADLVEIVHRLQYHLSVRIYRKAALLARRYLYEPIRIKK